MKFTKKITALLLAGIMTLSACNASDVVTTTGTEAPTVETTTEAVTTTTTAAEETTTTTEQVTETEETTTTAETTIETVETTVETTEAETTVTTEATTEAEKEDAVLHDPAVIDEVKTNTEKILSDILKSASVTRDYEVQFEWAN